MEEWSSQGSNRRPKQLAVATLPLATIGDVMREQVPESEGMRTSWEGASCKSGGGTKKKKKKKNNNNNNKNRHIRRGPSSMYQ